LATVFEDDWKASAAPKRPSGKKRVSALAQRASKRITQSLSRKLAQAPVVQHVVKAIENEADVKVDHAEAVQLVKGALRKAVRKASARIMEQAAT
jgi:hypothetical protein